MAHHDDDIPLGVPLMKPGGKSDAPASAERTAPAPRPFMGDDGRHPADELGLPVQLPTGARELTPQERAAVQAAEEEEANRIYDEAKEDFNRVSAWERLVYRTAWLAVLAASALLTLFVFAQSVQILAMLAAQPRLVQWLGWLCLLALLLILAAFAARLVMLFLRLRANRQTSLKQFQELSRRAELRAMVDRDKKAAKVRLREYLQAYHYGRTPSGKMIHSCFNEQVNQQLCEARDYLLDDERFADYDGWFKDFERRFQKVLEDRADQVVRGWMRRVGLKTALSPWPLVDTAFVLYCSYGMIGDLCQVFNLRMTRQGTILLLGYASINAYAAGQIEEHATSMIESVFPRAAEAAGTAVGAFAGSVVAPGVGTFAGGLAGAAAGKVLAKMTAQAAGGLANAFLIARLGAATIARLRPVNPH